MKVLQLVTLTVCGLSMMMPMTVSANDRVGFVGTGGIQSIKNNNIQIKSEDLFISNDVIRVNYQYENVSNHDIEKMVSIPLPRVDSVYYGDFADTAGLINSIKIWSNGTLIQPNIQVRAYMHDVNTDVDVTQALKSCGLTDKELMSPWLDNDDVYKEYQISYQHKSEVDRRIRACQQPKVQSLIKSTAPEMVEWQSEIIYSWKQTFKANAITKIKHEYKPLLGGTVVMNWKQAKNYCINTTLQKKRHRLYLPSTLRYILTTSNHGKKPIEDFTLTIQRKPDEYVSLCWEGELKKINRTTFQGKEKNFIPPHDLNILFFSNDRYSQ